VVHDGWEEGVVELLFIEATEEENNTVMKMRD
jgi:hypothetical protein